VPPLPSELRRGLERAVIQARDIAEEGARAALAVLAVEAPAAPATLAASDRDLRTALRAHGRAIGGGVLPLGIDGLVEEIAYEQWHRMLFARFLAENGLLFHPGGAAVSMAEVVGLAAEGEERDPWVLAARYASAMLPGIFRADDPSQRVSFAPEYRARLEAVLAVLPPELFAADDALGWVYQFWQTKRKKEVNDSGRKIGGADLPPVTQLFTEHYMVRFLLENSLGAWWATRHPESPLLREWEYLRVRDDGAPAAGTFDGWPDRAAEITVMDPCMGSGHFLVAAGDMLRKMRMEEEGLTEAQAPVVVLRDNLFGLELDPRCTQLGAFALAFDAWKAGGYQLLPVPNVACSGIAIKGQLQDWGALAAGDGKMADALERLYALFQDAPELGSLIDPAAAAGQGLWRVDPGELAAKLEIALAREANDPAAAVFGAAAEGTAAAARLLAGHYWLVATNVPYLGSSDHGPVLAAHLASRYANARHDLAYAFMFRCRAMLLDRGTTALVCPQAWSYLNYSRAMRQQLLDGIALDLWVRIGTRGFDEISGEVVNVGLAVASLHRRPKWTLGLDVSGRRSAGEKAGALRSAPIVNLDLSSVISDGDPIAFGSRANGFRLGDLAFSAKGVCTGDFPRFGRKWWEVTRDDRWSYSQTASNLTVPFAGRENAILWEHGRGRLLAFVSERLSGNVGAWIRGHSAWGRSGVAVSRVSGLQVTRYSGDLFDDSIGVLVPNAETDLPALWAYCTSPEFAGNVRAVNQKLSVDNSYLKDIAFDLERWREVAADRFPNGLPAAYSDDPTQWLFNGTVAGSTAPLQVAVGRLLGYRWPDQAPDVLDGLADADGIVPLPAVVGEIPAAERLRVLLAHAYGSDWSPTFLDRLLADAGSPGATLESWLRDEFFAQHARHFANRPFVWQVWDGRKDGFSVLLNYHSLNTSTLEKLTYTYLNGWIERQRGHRDEPGSEARLVAALNLQDKLKPLAHQPIGWDPDIDDGIRLNIRPFVTAGILRAKFTVSWNKDRGENPDGSERFNDLHFARTKKLAAREGGDE
jgi:hypothetical protein